MKKCIFCENCSTMHIQCYCITTNVCLKCFYRVASGFIMRKEGIKGAINIEWIYSYLTFNNYEIQCNVCQECIVYDETKLQNPLI